MSKAALFTAKSSEQCPECGAELMIRNGSHGPFLGCSRYPECHFIRPLKQNADGHIIKVMDGHFCSECGTVLVLRQGRYGMFIGCNNYPECGHTEPIHKSEETQVFCPQCSEGKLLQRKSRYGKVFHACERYPVCQFTINHPPVSGECKFCHYPLLIKKKTAQGMVLFCASKVCGKKVSQVEK